MIFHRDLPPMTEEVWDIVAKTLMLRVGGFVAITKQEIETAQATQATISLEDNGSIVFRIEGH